MKKIYFISSILLFIFSKNTSFTQSEVNESDLNYKKYDQSNGFEVYDTKEMIFDDLGWLWIAGNSLESDNTLDGYNPIIQRYDGQSFYTVELPDSSKTLGRIHSFKKRKDGQFYVGFKSTDSVRLFKIIPSTLIFKEIILPSQEPYQDLFLENYGNNSLVYLRRGIETKLYLINDSSLQFVELPHPPVTKEDPNEIPFYSNFIPFGDHFIISDDRHGVYSYNLDGSVNDQITHTSLKIPKNNSILKITTWFKKGDDTYVLFSESDDYYKYDSEKRTWVRSVFFDEESEKNNYLSNLERVFSDGLGNIVRQQISLDQQVIHFYLNDRTSRTPIKISSLINSGIASRDLKKELYVEYKGNFHHYVFQDELIKIFLNDKSIRSMVQLDRKKVLVATENSGWYKINLLTNEEERYDLTLDGTPYLINGSRRIFDDRDTYWSHDHNGIIKVDKNAQACSSYVYYPVADMLMEDGIIYCGTNIQNLFTFDTKTENYEVITSTSSYDVQGMVKVENNIYLATTTGMVSYENNELKLFKPSENTDHSYLIAITYHDKHGLLVGSLSGKLYHFNPKAGSFDLRYEDELKATIASILTDDADRIWMNTFNGIVAWDSQSHEANRYNMSDGLSYYEANRYSALKLEDGHFLVGTLKGLNYFHPDSISKNILDTKLTLTSLTYFDEQNADEVVKMAPHELVTLSEIRLPAINKSLLLNFGIVGSFNSDPVNYRYRLSNQPWIDLKNSNELKLFSLAAGNFDLEIQAIDSAKNPIGSPIMLSITVDELFYKSWWFYLIVVLSIFMIGIWYYLEQRKKYRLKAQFANQIIKSQEQERTRIAKDLHDSVGQRLLLLKNSLITDGKAPSDMNLIEDTINEVRNMSHNLHPFQFEKLGLVKSLENMMDAFQKSSGVFYSYDIENISGLIPVEKELFLFRMLQECINNVEKHAEATACNLRVYRKNKSIIFQLKDNGKGFSVSEKLQSRGSLGLQSLNERAQYINADFDLESEGGIGTTITLKMEVL